MRVLFMGTPDFALFTLKALVTAGEEIVGVVTQPDKPRGRGYELQPPPVKVYATEQGIPVYQPATLKNGAFDAELAALAPDVIVVVAYGKILPPSVLNYPRYGCVNVHGSLLPRYRGAAPMQRAIMEGNAETGVTTMLMNEGLDTGDMLLTARVPIRENDNFEDIHDKLGEAGAVLLIETLQALEAGTVTPKAQAHECATYAAKIEKADCLIDFTKNAHTVHNTIRGLSPIPLAFTHTPDGKLLKVIGARVGKTVGALAAPGTVLSLEGEIEVACGEGSVFLTRVLPEGKGRMSAADYIRGRRLSINDTLN
ncbi:MAG: methionyl-tRNA formyltransferase [Ruminococcaceae bacterium]|nr:methionyl-tRNA formyltransferase [Oscillospiraceae bacterium]